MSSRKTVLVVTGSLFALVAMGLLIAGGVLTGISETRSDPDGYWTSPTFELSTDTHALTSEQLDLGGGTQRLAACQLAGHRQSECHAGR